MARSAYFRVARPRRKLSLLLEPSLARYAMRGSGLARPNWGRVDRLVFACLGNICRSAYASAILEAFGLPTASFGFRAKDGRPADRDAIEHAKARGFDLSAHSTLTVESVDVRASDCLLLLDSAHVGPARELCEEKGAQFYPLGYYLLPPARTIPDPYRGPPELFRYSFTMIDLAASAVMQEIAAQGRLQTLRLVAGSAAAAGREPAG